MNLINSCFVLWFSLEISEFFMISLSISDHGGISVHSVYCNIENKREVETRQRQKAKGEETRPLIKFTKKSQIGCYILQLSLTMLRRGSR